MVEAIAGEEEEVDMEEYQEEALVGTVEVEGTGEVEGTVEVEGMVEVEGTVEVEVEVEVEGTVEVEDTEEVVDTESDQLTQHLAMEVVVVVHQEVMVAMDMASDQLTQHLAMEVVVVVHQEVMVAMDMARDQQNLAMDITALPLEDMEVDSAPEALQVVMGVPPMEAVEDTMDRLFANEKENWIQHFKPFKLYQCIMDMNKIELIIYFLVNQIK